MGGFTAAITSAPLHSLAIFEPLATINMPTLADTTANNVLDPAADMITDESDHPAIHSLSI
ncbi:hypothetical protein BC828DRAFT_404980 [Blastocladiella britannica]|nr:hypothetical protein BC828DRAFT_404980 [Blastocladiella britannica]